MGAIPDGPRPPVGRRAPLRLSRPDDRRALRRRVQVESWGGYFTPFRDGPLRLASKTELDAHDPTLLVRAEAPLLRRLHTRFFLSTGPGHGRVSAAATVRFARLLHALRLPYRLELLDRKPGAWERQLVDGLRWAFAAGSVPALGR